MRRLLSTIAVAAFAGSALAADLPATKSAPAFAAPAPVYNWTGFYLGADVGGAWAQGYYRSSSPEQKFNPGSVIGGGYAGYNYQINQFVLGLQGEFDGTGINGKNSSGFGLKEDYIGSVDGRLGYAADRVLFYVLGGVAFTNTKFTLGTASYNGNTTGYDVGGGIEYAFLPNWTVRGEYHVYEFGSIGFTPAAAVLAVPTNNRMIKSDSVVRVGLDYKFGAPEPIAVVAKY